MKTCRAAFITFKTSSYMLPALLLGLCSIMLSACQKEPETTTDIQTPVTISTNENPSNQDIAIGEQATDTSATEVARAGDLVELDNDIEVASAVTVELTSASAEQPIAETQITDVKYRSAAGLILTVVFETSATGVLNAIVSLPNTPKMTLSAPEGQGNNPTYRSTDGSIELISHGGGSTIDVMQNNKVTSFDAISADAAVVTNP